MHAFECVCSCVLHVYISTWCWSALQTNATLALKSVVDCTSSIRNQSMSNHFGCDGGGREYTKNKLEGLNQTLKQALSYHHAPKQNHRKIIQKTPNKNPSVGNILITVSESINALNACTFSIWVYKCIRILETKKFKRFFVPFFWTDFWFVLVLLKLTWKEVIGHLHLAFYFTLAKSSLYSFQSNLKRDITLVTISNPTEKPLSL